MSICDRNCLRKYIENKCMGFSKEMISLAGSLAKTFDFEIETGKIKKKNTD